MRTPLCWGLMLVGVGMAGCGSGGSQADLSGEVTLDGVPIEQGSILLVPSDPSKGTTAGGEIKAGKYSLTGKQSPGVGSYKVEIHANKKSGRQVQKSFGKPGELEDELMEAVAAKYNKQTTLVVDVKPGGGTANFEVFSK